jgi:AcrR family transcriptional regulator
MTSPGLRERRRLQTREDIIDAALDLFERKGYEATTVEDISAAADVSPRTFFRYFDSKLDVVMATKKSDDVSLGDLVAGRPPSESPIEAMHQLFRAQVNEMLAENGGPSIRQYCIVMTSPDLRSLALQHFHEHEEDMAQALAVRMGVSPGDLRPRVMAAAVIATAWAVFERWMAEGAATDRVLPLIDEAFALLKSGFE